MILNKFLIIVIKMICKYMQLFMGLDLKKLEVCYIFLIKLEIFIWRLMLSWVVGLVKGVRVDFQFRFFFLFKVIFFFDIIFIVEEESM